MTAEAGGSSPPRPSGLESKLGRQTIGSQSPSPWRSQPCHAFTEPGGYTRSQEDTKKIQFEYRRNRADTTEHERTSHLFEAGCDFLNLTPPRSLWPARERRAGQQ